MEDVTTRLAEALTFPDWTVISKGPIAPAPPVNSIVKRAYASLEDSSLFHISNKTCLVVCVGSEPTEPVLDQNSTVTPVSKLLLRLDSREPLP